ncbi:amidohydrolase family protein [Micromonospora coxensis]|uniref:Predicted metal-dependent hydrolase, TIM-barrel fold n=1 Tax=Micromonospora coxensis TaxID=356852 RepID=A0A1C5K454_9ACTN|nr:amidohydrolase family protein [Micromonospora coxensis]SCG77116.1 Predicted metal-dependent hydrolase, TIM-barrel fold [Micromonospora coxensis]
MNPFVAGDLPAVTLDVDVLVGRHPDRPGPDADTRQVIAALSTHGIARAAVASLRAALFDVADGNDEAAALAGPRVLPVGAVDLRDPLGAEREIDRLAERGVRAVRLFPDEQRVEADFPSVRHVARRAARAGLVILAGGDVRRFWRPLRGTTVVFLDTHFYHLGDFVVAARDEPGFHTSTRLLNSPDALETVAEHLGVDRLLYGSRTPWYEAVVPRLRLARSGLTPDQVAAVAGGNAHRILEPPA